MTKCSSEFQLRSSKQIPGG